MELRDDLPTKIRGYAAKYYREDDAGTEFRVGRMVERIAPNAFDRSIAENDVRAYYNHDSAALLGRTGNGTLRLSSDEIGLRFEIDVDHTDPDHQRLLPKLKRGDLQGASFGFQIRDAEDSHEKGTLVRTITDANLIEVSPVGKPAYESTTAEFRSLEIDEVTRRLRVLEIDEHLYKGLSNEHRRTK